MVSHQSEASDQELLFCTDICGDEGPSACPLASYIASDYPELKIACLPAGSAGMSAEAKIEVCTLVAIKDCPDDMVSFESATGNVLCYFAAEN